MASNSIVTVSLLGTYDSKLKTWIRTKNQEVVDGYQEADTALKNELLGVIGNINSFEVKVVEALPQEGVAGTIYLVKENDGEYNVEQNVYAEYIWYKKQEATEEQEAVFGWERIGDTKLDLDSLKSDIASDVADAYVKSVDVSDEDATVGAVTTKTYTLSFKNGDGEEIDSETISAISNIGVAVADVEASEGVEGVEGHDGLLSKEDKAKLDNLVATKSDYITTADADAKYVGEVEVADASSSTDGYTTVTTQVVTLKSEDEENDIGTFTLTNTTYAEAQSEVVADDEKGIVGKEAVGGLLSKADKIKLDGLESSDAYDSKFLADLTIDVGEGVEVEGVNATQVTVEVSGANGKGETVVENQTFVTTTYGVASAEKNGLLSKDDKSKLDAITYATEDEINALFQEENTQGE